MAIRSNTVTLLGSFALSCLFACGASHGEDAKGPETNPWADYKGTYATAAGSSAKASKAEVAKAEAKAKEEAAAAALAEETVVEEAPAPAPPVPAKKAKSAPRAGKAAARGAKKK